MDNMKKYTVYIHKSPSNKYYVGITGKTPQQRWGCEGYGYKTQKKFYRAIQKYGWNSFEHIIVATDLTLEQAYKMECELIIKYDSKNNGYNADDGGAGATGHIVSEETRQILSLRKKGTHQKMLHPPLPKRNIYLYDLHGDCLGIFLGYKAVCELLDLSQSSIINACNYGKLLDNKYILVKESDLELLDDRLKLANNRLYQPKIFQYTLDGQLIASYVTYKEASEATGISIGDIGKCCSGISLTKQNYIFLRVNLSESIQERINNIKQRNNCLVTREYLKNKYIIKQFNLYTNELLNCYNSYKEAAEATNIAYKKIIANCSGKLKKINDFYFIREDLEEDKK